MQLRYNIPEWFNKEISQWRACWGSPIHLAIPYLACLSPQKTEDVPIKLSAKCCQGSGSGSSGSVSSHSSSGGSLPHTKEQLPKYQVKASLPWPIPPGADITYCDFSTGKNTCLRLPLQEHEHKYSNVLWSVSCQCCSHTLAFVSW